MCCVLSSVLCEPPCLRPHVLCVNHGVGGNMCCVFSSVLCEQMCWRPHVLCVKQCVV